MIEPLIIEPTDDSPKVYFDKQNNFFEISGRSLPEEVFRFYSIIIDWIKQYAEDPNETTVVKLNLDYFNSASQRYLVEVLSAFEEIQKNGKKVIIEWHYKEYDEEMKESGEEYMDILNLEFKFLPYSKNN